MLKFQSKLSTLLASAVLAVSFTGCGTPAFHTQAPQLFNAAPLRNFNASPAPLSNRVLLGYKGRLSPQRIQQLEQQYQLRFVRDIAQIQVALFQSQGNKSTLSKIQRDPAVTFAGPDQSPRRINAEIQEVPAPQAGQGDPLKDKQWSLKAVQAEEAWQITQGSKDVIVAVVDTGVDLEHKDLKDNLLEGYNAENPGTPPQDGHYHGTHVAGIIAAVADNGEGVAGIAPGVKILPVRTISQGGVAEVADGIVWAADHGARVINLSLGWDYPSASVEETIKRAVKYALDKNVVICAAMSNSGTYNPKSSPDNLANQAGFEGVLAVGNIDKNDRRNGAPGEWKSVSSPGTDIISTMPGNRYGNLTGTSMATPMVSGIVALALSQNLALSNADVRKTLMARAVDLGQAGFDKEFGAGRINALRALSEAQLRINASKNHLVIR